MIRSLKPEVARVDTGGHIIAAAPGQAIAQAACRKLKPTLPAGVAANDFALVPSRVSLAPGEVDTLHASVPSQGNRILGGLVQWRSTDSSVASVSSGGVVRARAVGQAEVIATAFTQEHRATVSVHRVP